MENGKILINTKDFLTGNLREKTGEYGGITNPFSTDIFEISFIHTEYTGFPPGNVDKLSTMRQRLSTENGKVINLG